MITVGKTPYQPSDVDYDESRLNVLNNHFMEQMDKHVIRAAVYCLSREGKVFSSAAIGKQSYKHADERPLLPDSIHKIASITKLVTATAVMTLVEDGKLRLSQRIAEFLPELEPFYPINTVCVSHLMTHTGGFAVDPGALPDNGKPSAFELISKEVTSGGKEWVKALAKCDFRFAPGTQWAYSSVGFMLLGEIISRVSGVFAEKYITDRILVPCGMKDSFFGIPSAEQLDRIAVNSEKTEKLFEEMRSGTLPPSPWAGIPETGGGLCSTAPDLVRFGNMLCNGGYAEGGRVIGRKAIEKMTTSYLPETVLDHCWQGKKSKGLFRAYGLGPDMRHTDDFIYSEGTFFHEGAGRCSLIVDPVEKLVAAYIVPYVDHDLWDAVPLWNTSSIIWSGLK